MSYLFETHKITGGIGADDEYWRSLEDGKFKLSRCAQCRRGMWPAHFRCGHCGGWDVEWMELPAEGTIYSWTRTHYPFDRVSERVGDVPFVTVLAEIDHSEGARVLGLLTGGEEGLRIGARVRGVVMQPAAKSKNYPSICWQLIRNGSSS
jgi:uncharacterized OB-fold protein